MNLSIFGTFTSALALAASTWMETLILSILAVPLFWFAVDFGLSGVNTQLLQLVLWVPQMAWAAFASLLFFNAFEKRVQDEKSRLTLQDALVLTFSMTIANICVSIAVTLGWIFCIVPGIVVALGLFLTQVVIFKEGCGPGEALQRSWSLTAGSKVDMFLLFVGLWVVATVITVSLLGAGIYLLEPTELLAWAEGVESVSLPLKVGIGGVLALGSTFSMSVLRAIEFTLYHQFHRPVRHYSAYVPPHATAHAPPAPVVHRDPIEVDDDIVFGDDKNRKHRL